MVPTPVDLGLSVLWSPQNLGATSPEDHGCYFAWGELYEKEIYNDGDYVYYDAKNRKLTKYSGTGNGEKKLDACDDAATYHWGGSWRMPTGKELDELIKKCTWKWGSSNGVKGWVVKGPSGKSIFIAPSGNRQEHFFDSAGEYFGFWCSTMVTTTDAFPQCLYLSHEEYMLNFTFRFNGRTIRPVCSKK